MSLRNKAQTISELAIFGGILIFVLGAIVRQAMNYNYMQNQSLEAMRTAFRESFLSGEAGNSSRNNASILSIEDRKDVLTEGGRYGSTARTPYIVGGSGAHTKHMFMGQEYPDSSINSDIEVDVAKANLAKMDIFVNGKHFTLTAADFDNREIFNPTTGQAVIGAGCSQYNIKTEANCSGTYPCAVFYTKIPNGDSRFCPRTNPPPCTISSAEEDDRFDLDRDGTTDVPTVPSTLREKFAWQWYPVKMTADNVNLEEGKNTSVDIDCDLKLETILALKDSSDRTGKDGHYTPSHTPDAADTGMGYLPEHIRTLYRNRAKVFKHVYYLDPQSGDIDMTYDTRDKQLSTKSKPGLQEAVKLYSFVKSASATSPGTYFEINEGKLYSGDSKQYIRNTNRTDRVDIVERQFQLSNDTERMWPERFINPVQVRCGVPACCTQPANIYKTCFDQSSLMLYIRTRTEEKSGRKLITDVSQDKMLVK